MLAHARNVSGGPIGNGAKHFSKRPALQNKNAKYESLKWISLHSTVLDLIGSACYKYCTHASEVTLCVSVLLYTYILHRCRK